MKSEISKDTVLCTSFSARPGNFGTRLHNFLYQEMGLGFLYKAFAVTDIEGAVQAIRTLGIRGSAISMPFKETVIEFLDELDPMAREIGAVNTIVNDQGRLKGLNTDYIAVKELLVSSDLNPSKSIALLGSGGMARAIAFALRDTGFKNTILYSRNQATGTKLSREVGFVWAQDSKLASASHQSGHADILINATPIGMIPNTNELPFDLNTIAHAQALMDSVANPEPTSLVREGMRLGKQIITGEQITLLQAREQFRLYTGLLPSVELLERAARFARS